MEQNNTMTAITTPYITPVRISSKYADGPTVMELQSIEIPDEFYTLTGRLRFTMLNDAMFHIVLEANPELLKALVCALLPLDPDQISSLVVTNPLRFGKHMDDKTCILDVNALLNDNTIINIELQVESLPFWKERSMEYLCRLCDNVEKGASYLTLKPAIHIGIVNFDTVPDEPEFYATYHMANDRTHRIYTGKMRLSVLHLNRKELATETDLANNLHFWAEFFNVKTWEELHMLAENNPVVAEAAKTMYRVSAEEEARHYCEMIERSEKTHQTFKDIIANQEVLLSEKDSEIAALKAKLAALEKGTTSDTANS